MRDEGNGTRAQEPLVLKVPARAIEPLRRFYALLGIAAIPDDKAALPWSPESCDVLLRDSGDAIVRIGTERTELPQLSVAAPVPETLAARCWDSGCTVLVDHDAEELDELVVVGPLGARVTIRRDDQAA